METEQFLPCCPLDHQELLPLTDFLLDDFVQMENIGETENTNPIRECTITQKDKFIDLMDSTCIQHQKCLCPEKTNICNKNKITEDDKECFLIINCSNKNSCLEDQTVTNCDDDLPETSEKAILLSSVPQTFTSGMLNTLKDETFDDLKMLLKEEHTSFTSVDTSTSRDNPTFTDVDTNTTRSLSTNEVYLDTMFSSHEQSKYINTSQESDINFDSDETWEPSKKILKLNGSCKPKYKDAKYAEMRRKNNSASRRSRQTKKQQEKEMEEKADTLEKENESLRIKEKKLQELVDKLKQILFSSVNKKK